MGTAGEAAGAGAAPSVCEDGCAIGTRDIAPGDAVYDLGHSQPGLGHGRGRQQAHNVVQCGQQWLVKLEGHPRATSFNTDVLHAAAAAAAAAVLQPFEPVRLEAALPRGDIGRHVASYI